MFKDRLNIKYLPDVCTLKKSTVKK